MLHFFSRGLGGFLGKWERGREDYIYISTYICTTYIFSVTHTHIHTHAHPHMHTHTLSQGVRHAYRVFQKQVACFKYTHAHTKHIHTHTHTQIQTNNMRHAYRVFQKQVACCKRALSSTCKNSRQYRCIHIHTHKWWGSVYT